MVTNSTGKLIVHVIIDKVVELRHELLKTLLLVDAVPVMLLAHNLRIQLPILRILALRIHQSNFLVNFLQFFVRLSSTQFFLKLLSFEIYDD